jgi:metallo-beta-lactamase family protein
LLTSSVAVPQQLPVITHHGATSGVTGYCHRLTLADGRAALVDIGLKARHSVGFGSG